MVNYSSYINGPSLLTPTGGEFFIGGEMSVTWIEPEDMDFDAILIWYEILFTSSYGKFTQPEWIQIAKIPTGNTSFTWTIPYFIKSDKCRIGIRLVDYKGQRSKVSFSPNNFSIREKRLPIPAVFEPADGYNYFSYVPIVIDNKGLIDQCSRRAFYQIYYNCESLEIEWTLLFSHVPLTSGPLYWDISEFTTSTDYSLKIELVDEETVSEPIFIKNIIINSLNYFMIDTEPPVGEIKVIKNTEYTKERDVVLNSIAYDSISGSKSIRIEQYDIGVSDSQQPDSGPYKDVTEFSTWHVQGDDGVKLIQARFKDWGGNITLENADEEFLRTYKDLNNNSITAFLITGVSGNKDKWIAFGGNLPKLCLNENEVADLDGEATFMIYYKDILYIAIRNNQNVGTLQRYSGGLISNVYQMSDADSAINSMCEFDNKIFMGLENGELWDFDGVSFSLENYGNRFDSSITHLGTNDNILYIFFDSSITALGMRKDKNDMYNFYTVSLED